jgi:hypothetical protein
MAHFLGNNPEPFYFKRMETKWQRAKETTSERTWTYVLKDTEAWKIN